MPARVSLSSWWVCLRGGSNSKEAIEFKQHSEWHAFFGDIAPNWSACLKVESAFIFGIAPNLNAGGVSEHCMFLVARPAKSNYGKINMSSNFLLSPGCHNPKCLDAFRFLWVTMIVQEEKFILLNLLLCTISSEARALPAFTNLKKLDKETITRAFLKTLAILIYFLLQPYFQGQHISGFLIKWCRSKVAAWPPEQAPWDVNSSCMKCEHRRGTALVLLWESDLDLCPGSRLPSQRGGGHCTFGTAAFWSAVHSCLGTG